MMTEQQIFEELSTLCGEKGFIHTLVEIYFKDNYFQANQKGNFTTSKISEFQADRRKLNRNELNTLLALIVKNNPNFFHDEVPKREMLDEYSARVYKLLEDFHNILLKKENMTEKILTIKETDESQIKYQESNIFLIKN